MSILERFRLDGKVAIVTGASSGFGAATARAFAEAGADVALGARRPEKLAEVAAEVEALGRRAVTVTTDVTDRAQCDALVEAAVSELGRLDILVNNAGAGLIVPALREAAEDFLQVMDVNLNACYWMAQSSARAMTHGGSIVNIASIAGIRSLGLPQAAYSASKGGLISLTRDLAQQWTGRRGIRVNAVLPGLFETEMTGQYFADRFERDQLPRIPAGRGGRVDELAAAVLFLASEAASYISGEALVVDGGRTVL